MPTQIDQVATVYARSLFELARELGGDAGVASMGAELREVCDIVRADARAMELFRSPIVDPGQRAASLKRIFGGRVTDTLLNFMLVLNRKGRLAELPGIHDAYDALEQEAFGRIEVDVFTASGSVDEATKASIAADLRKSMGKEPVLHFYADPAMIGGLKLRIGDRLIDGSVAAQLRRMRSTLLDRGLGGRDAGSFLA
ncbi:MAG: synthase subunit delta [Planctomycetota bacterium]|jgi:F-type H+-transporting ATPase subunit delta